MHATGLPLAAPAQGGALKHDLQADSQLFGPGATPERLLAGLVPPPQEFALLYDALSQAAA